MNLEHDSFEENESGDNAIEYTDDIIAKMKFSDRTKALKDLGQILSTVMDEVDETLEYLRNFTGAKNADILGPDARNFTGAKNADILGPDARNFLRMGKEYLKIFKGCEAWEEEYLGLAKSLKHQVRGIAKLAEAEDLEKEKQRDEIRHEKLKETWAMIDRLDSDRRRAQFAEHGVQLPDYHRQTQNAANHRVHKHKRSQSQNKVSNYYNPPRRGPPTSDEEYDHRKLQECLAYWKTH
jgi:hypothetical protein